VGARTEEGEMMASGSDGGVSDGARDPRFGEDLLDLLDEEKQKWCILRAIEWGKWPLFIAQPIVPILLVFLPWWQVVGGVLALSWLWLLVRYSVVNITLVRFGAYFVVLLKWPVSIGAGIYLCVLGRYWLAALAALWPIVTLFLLFVTPPTQIGKVEQAIVSRLLRPAWAGPRSYRTQTSRFGLLFFGAACVLILSGVMNVLVFGWPLWMGLGFFCLPGVICWFIGFWHDYQRALRGKLYWERHPELYKGAGDPEGPDDARKVHDGKHAKGRG